jgi:hypothetical protein
VWVATIAIVFGVVHPRCSHKFLSSIESFDLYRLLARTSEIRSAV